MKVQPMGTAAGITASLRRIKEAAADGDDKAAGDEERMMHATVLLYIALSPGEAGKLAPLAASSLAIEFDRSSA